VLPRPSWVDGVARNDDLSVKSPLIRVGGNGDINLGDDRLDYLAKATVVNTLQGQGGPELQALRGVTIPVRLAGPFTAIGYNVDFKGLVTDLAKKKVDEKKEELKTRVQDQLKDKLKGLFGK
jgi:AsmA protein